MTAALVIAAGKRSGRDSFEPGMKIGTITAIQRIVLLFQQAGIKDIVVCGEEEEVKKLVPSMNLVFLPAPVDGEMIHSIQAGLSYLQNKVSQVLVCHVDVPLFSIQTVHTLLAAEGAVCVPSHQGMRGHPTLLRREVFEEILAYRGENGLKGAIDSCGCKREVVEVDDEGILVDVPHQEDYSKLLPSHDIGKLRLSYQFRIGREAIFYGPGVHQLLLLTEELTSLAEACKYMGISYSKGRKIIQTMEMQTGTPVLVTHQGGKGGGYSRLTEEARAIIRQYDGFLEEAEELLQGLFIKHFEA